MQEQREQLSKNVSKEDMRAKILEWYSVLRERLIRTGKQDDYDEKWGRFHPECRLNVDQSPCPFVFDSNRTYHQFTEDQHNEKVWISQPGAALDKRQFSLQICFSPKGKQPPLGIVFHGSGKRISEDERSSWHKDVHMSFQENAWVDTKITVDWVKKTLKTATAHLKRFILFADNLASQVHDDFKESVSGCSGVVWYGLPDKTSLWQPVDAAYAKMLKTLMEQEHHKWLDDEEHVDRWYGNEEPYSAKERRILITHWADEAYTKLCENEYDDFRRKLWLKTGCLISVDGSNDNKIAPEGLPNYQVSSQHQYLEPAGQLSKSNQVEFEEPSHSDTMMDENNFLPDDQELHERIDREEDCIVDRFVGRKIYMKSSM